MYFRQHGLTARTGTRERVPLVDLKGAEVVYGCSTPMYNIKDFKGVIVSTLASTLATRVVLPD